MPEYVYALHDFLPEHEDEVSFRAGERIEVVEKDDLYGDGWWQGRNLLGKVGLFPVSYTASVPPASAASSLPASDDAAAGTPSKTVLQPLHEESESELPPAPDILSPVPKQPLTSFLSTSTSSITDTNTNTNTNATSTTDTTANTGTGTGYDSESDASLHLSRMPDGEVMKATMTDVQKAIEQLGRRGRGARDGEGGEGDDADGGRSFSFASTRDGVDTETDETDFDLSDVDGGRLGGGEDWHKDARTKLAAKARRAVAEAEKLEAMLASGDPSGSGAARRGVIAPPIEVELSDESDGEDDADGGEYTRGSRFHRRDYILEEDEGEEEEGVAHQKELSSTATATATQRSSTIADADGNSNHIVVPPRDEMDVPTATAAQLSFPVFSPPPPAAAAEATAPVDTVISDDAKALSMPVPMPAPALLVAALSQETQKRESLPAHDAAAAPPVPETTTTTTSVADPKHMSVGSSSSSAPPMPMPMPTASVFSPPAVTPAQDQQAREDESDLKTVHPTEWTVEQVVAWLKSKGFADVCDKFIEQEITGDVLLELTPDVLKSEIGIMAFGKRVRIANAISELRRPPSVEYPAPDMPMPVHGAEHVSPASMQLHHQHFMQGQAQGMVSQPHSRTQSQSHSHRSFPGTGTSTGAGMSASGLAPINPQSYAYAYAPSQQSSLGSPMAPQFPAAATASSSFVGGGSGSSPSANGYAYVNGYGNGSSNGNGYAGQFDVVPEGQSYTAVGGGAGGSGAGESGSGSGVLGAAAAVVGAAGLGLGIGLGAGVGAGGVSPNGSPKRPLMLGPSPSDSALKESAAKAGGAASSSLIVPKADEDDRGHMSDGEIPATSQKMRRRLWGRSQDSTPSARLGSPLPSPSLREMHDRDKDSLRSTKDGHQKEGKEKDRDRDSKRDSKDKDKDRDSKDSKEKEKDTASVGSHTRHARAKKSVDGAVKPDRLSIFGGTFAGTLGKSRKPPPSATDEPAAERTSKFMLPRLHGPSLRKASSTSQRPSTPSQSSSPKDVFAHHDEKDRDTVASSSTQSQTMKGSSSSGAANTLRKRTTSTQSHSPVVGSYAASSTVVGWKDEKEGKEKEKEKGGKEKEKEEETVGTIKQGQSILEQIGEPDHVGWMRKKGDRYNSWKLRYFVLKGPHLYWMRSNSKTETRIKGYIHIVGYKVTVDENVDPGRYGFRIDHDHDKTHYFSSEEKSVVRDWMKAIMKATIGRDYTKPVVSSCNIPTIPLVVAQAMNPAPRPPSPTARDATQKALRREYPDQLSSRDARVLMGLPGSDGKDERQKLDSFFSDDASTTNGSAVLDVPATPTRRTAAPPRPSREMRRSASVRTATTAAEDTLIEWANTHLPENLQITEPTGPLCGGLALLRLAESIKGRPSSPPVPDSAFPSDPNDDKLDGLFRLFDFLLDNDVKMGSVSINDVRQGKRDKIVQLLRALKAWEDKRRALANTIAKGSMQAGAGFMVPVLS